MTGEQGLKPVDVLKYFLSNYKAGEPLTAVDESEQNGAPVEVAPAVIEPAESTEPGAER